MEHLDTIVKIATLTVSFAALAKWIVNRIERGQKVLIKQHRRDFRMLKKELQKRISRKECALLRTNCPCKEAK